MSSRRPPLHTCAVCVLEIADKARKHAQQLHGPLGSMAKNIVWIASFSSSFVCVFQFQLLVLLSLFDDRILAVQYVIEAVFPPSGYVFDKIDELVRTVEVLPGKFDELVAKFPDIVHQVPLLDSALFQAIWCLNFFLSIMMQWGSEPTKEKEILIDKNCCQSSINESDVDRMDRRTKPGKKEIKQDCVPLTISVEPKRILKCSYKDALEKVVKGTYKDALENNKPKKEDIRMANYSPEKKEIGGAMAGRELKVDVDKETSREGNMKNMKEKEHIHKIEIEKSRSAKEAMTENGENETEQSKEVNGNSEKVEEKIIKEERILELFDYAWLASPQNKGKSSSLSRSASYQW